MDATSFYYVLSLSFSFTMAHKYWFFYYLLISWFCLIVGALHVTLQGRLHYGPLTIYLHTLPWSDTIWKPMVLQWMQKFSTMWKVISSMKQLFLHFSYLLLFVAQKKKRSQAKGKGTSSCLIFMDSPQSRLCICFFYISLQNLSS